MVVFYSITGLVLLISLIADRKKTLQAGRVALKKLLAVLPAFLMMLIFVTIALYIIPETMISAYLSNENAAIGFIAALILGSLTLMPGFIAFPLCGILLTKGVPYMVLAAFSTSLMMVGVITFPLEKEYFGAKTALIRNLISVVIVIAVALAIGLVYGELQ